jgi:hypothetical protein
MFFETFLNKFFRFTRDISQAWLNIAFTIGYVRFRFGQYIRRMGWVESYFPFIERAHCLVLNNFFPIFINQITIKANLMKQILNFRIECLQIFVLNLTDYSSWEQCLWCNANLSLFY